jgi:hypothetical protein
MTTPPEVYRNEWEVLLAWHREQQFKCADRELYCDAQDHKQRCEAISLYLTSRKEPTT